MDRKELPVGLQTFRTIRKEQGAYYYVDKTDYAYQLARKEGHFFLSRPRRFGKSLFVDTLKNLFEGDKELFKGLAIYDKWDWDVKYPVLRLDFTGGDFTKPGELKPFIMKQLSRIEQSEELTSDEDIAPERFADLIEKLYEAKGQRVVILVDEYDKPIYDALETPEMEDVARDNRNTLRAFYGIIKRCDKYIRFSFLTGVTKFAHAGIFSGLNNLIDITLEPEFSSICGYTDHDLDTVFAPELERLEKISREEIKEWYNGYNWGGEENVYNPFNILQLFRKRELRSWWFHTGTPTFLINELKRRGGINMLGLDGITAGDELLSAIDIGKIRTPALLFQTGYLTITREEGAGNRTRYRLGYPNREVRQSLYRDLLDAVAPVADSDAEYAKRLDNLERCINTRNFDGAMELLQTLCAVIPYYWYIWGGLSRYEGHFAVMVCSAFYGSGLDMRIEEPASGGRVDMAVVTATHVALFEFKVLKRGVKKGDAMKQLIKKNYARRYRSFGLPIYLVGMEFDPREREIASYEVREAE